MDRLDNKVVLITGSSGMGAAVARLAATKGARVFIAALAPEGCASLAAEIGGSWFAGDLSVENNAKAAVERCVAHFGRIDGAFNVAGISGRQFGDGPLHECSAEGWDTLMSINLRSLFLMSREVVRQMLAAAHGGSIVNMGSVVALSPEPRHFATHAYATSKGAIHAFTTATASYYASSGIRINAIAPGLVETPMSLRAQQNPEIREYMQTKQPLVKGFMAAEDVAAAVVFLLSDAARCITGEIIAVDGGWRLSA
jgi:NAD(P)-dependent dehydrogenase (short-subunit alcohol dehydrogenase family)